MFKGLKIVLSIAALVSLQTAAQAHRGNNFNITDGYGDGLVINHGFLGTGIGAVSGVQDRLGDKYVKKHGLFSKETDINVLGNRFEKHKGLFGTSYAGGTMLGDSITTKRTWLGLGRRQTNVNLSGVSGIVQQFAGGHFHKTPVIDPNVQASSTANPADFPVDPAFNLGGASGSAGAAGSNSGTLAPFSTH